MRPVLTSSPQADVFAFEEAAVQVTVSKRKAGDLAPRSPGSRGRRQRLIGGRDWAFTRQVHGALVRQQAGEELSGDSLVARVGELSPAMFAADCGLLGIVSPEGVVAAVHAGWRGLLAGVLEETAEQMRREGASELVAVRGPVIGPECYEFGEEELDRLVAAYGPSLAARAASGRPALDLRAGLQVACGRAGIRLVATVESCTSCGRGRDGEPLYFSYRARQEEARHGLVVSPLR